MNNTQNKIKAKTGDAIESLYALDNYLANSYFGDGGRSDRQISKVRKQLRIAMNAVQSTKIFPMLKGIE